MTKSKDISEKFKPTATTRLYKEEQDSALQE